MTGCSVRVHLSGSPLSQRVRQDQRGDQRFKASRAVVDAFVTVM